MPAWLIVPKMMKNAPFLAGLPALSVKGALLPLPVLLGVEGCLRVSAVGGIYAHCRYCRLATLGLLYIVKAV